MLYLLFDHTIPSWRNQLADDQFPRRTDVRNSRTNTAARWRSYRTHRTVIPVSHIPNISWADTSALCFVCMVVSAAIGQQLCTLRLVHRSVVYFSFCECVCVCACEPLWQPRMELMARGKQSVASKCHEANANRTAAGQGGWWLLWRCWWWWSGYARSQYNVYDAQSSELQLLYMY